MGERITTEDFARTYVDVALAKAKGSPSFSDFYESLFKDVSLQTGVSKKDVLYLHHAFHWAFFNNSDSPSPLRLVSPSGRGKDLSIGLKREASEEDGSNLTSYILERYRPRLDERFRDLN